MARFLCDRFYVPALLAKQVRSLTYIKQHGHGLLRVAPTLLILWFACHHSLYGYELIRSSLTVNINLVENYAYKVKIIPDITIVEWINTLKDILATGIV